MFNFLSKYTEWFEFRHHITGNTKLGYISLPYSKKTIKQIGRELTQDEIVDVIFKDYSNAHSWVMVDSSRNTYNVAGDYLRAESSAAENATYSVANNTAVDFLSNGFKLRVSGSYSNSSGATYIYMAFAEHPFKNSLAR